MPRRGPLKSLGERNAAIEFILLLIFVLAMVTLVGHGIWVLLAKLFANTVTPLAPPTGQDRRCPRCDLRLPPTVKSCRRCGWPRQPANRDKIELETLADLTRNVEDLSERGLIHQETGAKLLAVIQQEQQRVEVELKKEAVVAPAAAATLSLETALAAKLVVEEQVPVTAAATTVDLNAEVSLEDRVRQYAERRAAAMDAAALETPAMPKPAEEPKPPARPWSELLAAFLEQRHIRWGELVGGLLIVCCSVALVISFWAEIAEKPFLKFFVFNGVTAALFGVGMYTERRWKLETTSHGLLLIATLLVPLNFLAIAAFSTGTARLNAITLGGEAISIALFAALVYYAGRILLSPAPWLLSASVMVPAVLTLVVRRHVDAQASAWLLLALAGVLLASYAASNLLLLARARGWEKIGGEQAGALFKLLGLSTFAVVLPLTLLVIKSEAIADTLRQLAPLSALAGLPALAIGLLVWNRIADKEQAALRTAGTSLAVFGAVLVVAGIPLAWPHPIGMVPAAVLGLVLLTAVGIAFALPATQALAALCLASAGLLVALVGWGDAAWRMTSSEMATVLLSSHAAVALLPVSLVLVLAAGSIAWRWGREQGLWYLPVVATAAVASIALVSWHGFGVVGDPSGAVWIYATYAAVALAGGFAAGQRAAVLVGGGLLLAALVQGLAFTYAERLRLAHPWLLALVMHAAVLTLGAMATGWMGEQRKRALQLPLVAFGLAGSIAAAALTVWLIPRAAPSVPASATAALAAIWLSMAILQRLPAVFALAEVALCGAVVFGMATILARQPWVTGLTSLWLDPRSLQTQGIALCGLALAWLGTRSGARRWAAARWRRRSAATSAGPARFSVPERFYRLTSAVRPQLEVVLTAVALAILLALATYGAVPGALQELSPRGAGSVRVVPPAEQFELLGIAHEYALGIGSWLLAAAVLLLTAVSFWQRPQSWQGLALATGISAAVPLAAGSFESQVAVASALRWLSAGYLLLGSAVLWARSPLLMVLQALSLVRHSNRTTGASRVMRSGVIGLALLPLAAMGLYVAITAVMQAAPSRETVELLRCCAIGFLVAAVIAIVGCRITGPKPGVVDSIRAGSALLLVLMTAPLVAASLYAIAAALQQRPIVGPEPGSFFSSIGLAASYALPILTIAVALAGHGLRERDASFAFAGSLVLALAATAGYLLSLAKGGAALDLLQWVRLAQLNSGVLAAYALGWMGIVLLDRRGTTSLPERMGGLLAVQTLLSVTLVAAMVVLAGVDLFLNPSLSMLRPVIGSSWGWPTALLALSAGWLWARLRQVPFGPIAVSATLLAVGVLLTCSLDRWDTGNWLCYHALLISVAASAVAALATDVWLQRVSPIEAGWRRAGVIAWSRLLGLLTVVIALRAVSGDPQAPAWTIGATAAMAVFFAALACRSRQRIDLLIAAVLVNTAATTAWWNAVPRLEMMNLVWINIAALALPVPVWLLIELKLLRPLRPIAWRPVSVHAVIAWLAVFLLALTAAQGLAADLLEETIESSPLLGAGALVASLIAMGSCLWDPRMRSAVAGMYGLGLVACGLLVDTLGLDPKLMVWTGMMVVAAFNFGTSYLWSRREGLLDLARQIRIPVREAGAGAGRWMVTANGLLTLAVVLLAVRVELTFVEAELRLLAAKAVVAQALALALLARGERRSMLQYASLSVGVLGAIALSWSGLHPGMSGTLLNYAVATLAALVVMMVLYGLGLSKIIRRENDWTQAAQRLVPVVVVLGMGLVLAILAIETAQYSRLGAVRISPAAAGAVIASLLGIFAACLAAALIPGRDPLGLSERGRTAYVYAAEAVLALLFLHVRVTMPWLFSGVFQQYWPMIIVLIAFLGIGLGELFQRQRRRVLSEPLERTGIFLPVLPVVGYWFLPNAVHFSLVMLAVGALYGVLSALRRSFGFAVLATLTANAGLWYFLYHTGGWGLLEHPQLWLIPPAVCVLVAAYLNRRQLDESQMAAIRYFASAVIYVSSTADIFLTGVATAPWLPLVLGAISLVGIFAGILLRVRGFLFMGTGFLVLALLTIIWYAAVDLQQTWVWFVSGIMTGILIIAVLAMFEKKRQDVLQLVDRLKQWQA